MSDLAGRQVAVDEESDIGKERFCVGVTKRSYGDKHAQSKIKKYRTYIVYEHVYIYNHTYKGPSVLDLI